MTDTGAIARISRAYQLLSEAKDLADIKAVRDMAVAAAEYARAIKAGQDTVNEASEIVVRAERLAGLALAAAPKNTGGQPEQRRSTDTPGVSVERAPTLAEQGITPNQSKAWQDVAAVPENVFEEEIAESKQKRKPITTTSLAKKGREHKQQRAAKQEPAGRPGRSDGASVVNTQNIRDANLRADFSKCMVSVAQIMAYAPERIVEVMPARDADNVEQSFTRLSIWFDRFKTARESGSHLRAVVEG